MPLFDEHDNPLQDGLTGWQEVTNGFSSIKGPCIGIVLSVHFADSSENLLFEYMRGGDRVANEEKKKAYYASASVLLIQGTGPLSYRLDDCVIAQGKSSASNASKIPADYSEDLPNPSFDSLAEADDFFLNGAQGGTASLRGDWVLVDFIGGVQEQPIITKWFPPPLNLEDASTIEDGQRTLFRRRNSSLKIDKQGNVSITLPHGHYVQFQEQKVTVKHRQGQMIHLNEDGECLLVSRGGNAVRLGEHGFSVTTETCAVEMNDKDADISIRALRRGISLVAKSLLLVGGGVHATDGQTSGVGVVKGSLIPETVIDLVDVVASLPDALTGNPEAIARIAKGVASLNVKKAALKNKAAWLTRIFKAE